MKHIMSELEKTVNLLNRQEAKTFDVLKETKQKKKRLV